MYNIKTLDIRIVLGWTQTLTRQGHVKTALLDEVATFSKTHPLLKKISINRNLNRFNARKDKCQYISVS